MRNSIRRLSLILLCIQNSCDNQIDATEFIEEDSFIVIYSTISPQDEIIKVRVSKTAQVTKRPLQQNLKDLVIKNAKVFLSDMDKNQIELVYSQEYLNYQVAASKFPIKAGERYTLNVVINGKEFNASCHVPLKKILNIAHEFGSRRTLENNLRYSVRAMFSDIGKENNFYIVSGNLKGFSTNDTFLNFGADRFQTDALSDESIIEARGYLEFVDFEKLISQILVIQVANVEETLYRYLFAIYTNDLNSNNFLYETIIPPSNINGDKGIGVFAGINLLEQEIIIE